MQLFKQKNLYNIWSETRSMYTLLNDSLVSVKAGQPSRAFWTPLPFSVEPTGPQFHKQFNEK